MICCSRLSERAERRHARIDRVAAEHVPAQLEAAVVKLLRVHPAPPADRTAAA
jgi:hypothetical protein